MSNALFPEFSGLEWGAKKTPVFTTNIQKALTKAETRISYHDTPMYRWKIPLEFLRDDPDSQSPVGDEAEYKTLINFFLARKGAFESFLYKDPSDNAVTDQQFGTGDGTTTSFQLSRQIMGDFSEPVHNIDALQSITINGSPGEVIAYGTTWNETNDTYESVQSNHAIGSVSSTGVFTFLSPPPSDAVLRWTGTFYFRVRFDGDELDFETMMNRFWESQEVGLYGALQNKV